MPTYDYECTECGHMFEVFQSMSDDPLEECPKCSSKVRRLIGGGVGIIFKGSGFYVTDNKGASKSAAASAPAKTDSGSEKKPDSSASGKDKKTSNTASA